MECLKCGHIWQPRKEKPRRCPGCNQRRYDRPRVYTEHVPINNTQQVSTTEKVDKVIEKIKQEDNSFIDWQ